MIYSSYSNQDPVSPAAMPPWSCGVSCVREPLALLSHHGERHQMTIRKTFYLSGEDRSRFTALSHHYDLSWTSVLRLALTKLAEQISGARVHGQAETPEQRKAPSR